MIALTLGEIATITGGQLVGADPAALVTAAPVLDSRSAAPGSLFLALPGEHTDGALYAEAAVSAGAVAAVATRPTPAPTLVVADVTEAIARLARHVTSALPNLVVLGVTGSAGKTTTKDLLAAVLAPTAPTIAPVASWNNELGLPLTALRCDESTRFLALEYSARGVGHIAYLTSIVRPSLAAVLMVGSAHVGEFGSREAIAVAKGELIEALDESGTAVLNADDPLVSAMAPRTRAHVLTFGRGEGSDVRADDVRVDGAGRASFTISADGRAAPVSLQLVGVHQVTNALAAGALTLAAGLDIGDVAERLSAAGAASRWRMEICEGIGGATILNDAYNANPESVAAALETIAVMSVSGRRILVLGEMRELGDATEAAYIDAGRAAVAAGVDLVVAVGPAAGAAQAAGSRGVHVADADAAAALLAGQLAAGDLVLVKASRGARLERVVEALVAPA